MQAAEPSSFQLRIVPALRKIQDTYGYLNREALLAFHRESGIPLYRLQEVASFFPHFRLSEPPPETPITVHVCRDMACHLAGSAPIIQRLQSIPGAVIEGVSCLGRCDRAPAACVTVHQTSIDNLYLGRSGDELESIVLSIAGGSPPPADRDASLRDALSNWRINPYTGPSNYSALRRCAGLRNESIARATSLLIQNAQWSAARAERFRELAAAGANVKYSEDAELHDAVIAWQRDQGWAAGEQLGGWADPLLRSLDDSHADLRGMGGAGIPATTKWRDVRDAVRAARLRRADDRAFIVMNADESEPGTFKDRELLRRMPHLCVEGIILAGLITEAAEGFIYVRHEYHEQIEACREEIKRAERLGFCGKSAPLLGRPFPVSVFVSPGGYICGEQSALIEAMSDRRGEPRNLPPKLETNGLDDQPTLVSNVETFAWTPFIMLNGGQAYAELGVNGCKGARFFSVSGDVKRPGVYEIPMGLTLRELLFGQEYCRGIVGDGKLKALAPSGPSGGFLPSKLTADAGLPRDHTSNKTWLALAARRGLDPASTELDILDLELELNVFRALSPTQALGAGLVVYADGRNMLEEAVNAIEFYRNESCGKCVPCRVGSQKLAALGNHLLHRRIDVRQWNGDLLPSVQALGKVMELSSICGLGRSIPLPLKTVIEFFSSDLASYLSGVEQPAPLAQEAVS